jgi:hypothetical protein
MIITFQIDCRAKAHVAAGSAFIEEIIERAARSVPTR